jgi:hypothetical protein
VSMVGGGVAVGLLASEGRTGQPGWSPVTWATLPRPRLSAAPGVGSRSLLGTGTAGSCEHTRDAI